MIKPTYKTREENYQEALTAARTLTIRELRRALGPDRGLYHGWTLKACEKALVERQTKDVSPKP